ncbi:glutaminase A [Halalkalibacterium ligniniphilum]|uniref:glutaminase A n=1 Tax=Halalkalibacterium ligniniphilum TaxID=1134413 RepID=UPI00034509A8|nr:glutaminase A [Halalkalibacterium ligniniphilum]
MAWKQGVDLANMVKEAKVWAKSGKVADYIPALAEANPDMLAVAIYQGTDHCFLAGNVEEKFTLQSISKVLSLVLVLMDLGEDVVFSKVGMEPTGDPFNSIAKLETNKPSKPLNPMINAGALAVTNMIQGSTTEERLHRLLRLVHQLTGNEKITFNEYVANSELETAYLNRSLAYFMKQHGVVEGDIEELLDLYTKQCAIEMNCMDLARIGYVLAHEGCDPITAKRIIPLHIARIVKTFMVTCGMYNASGEFAIRVGIPAKSGVSGGILGAIPHRSGIGIYSPALDEKGNSLAGIKLLEVMAERYQLSIF